MQVYGYGRIFLWIFLGALMQVYGYRPILSVVPKLISVLLVCTGLLAMSSKPYLY